MLHWKMEVSLLRGKRTEAEAKVMLCWDICGFSLLTLKQQLGEGKRYKLGIRKRALEGI